VQLEAPEPGHSAARRSVCAALFRRAGLSCSRGRKAGGLLQSVNQWVTASGSLLCEMVHVSLLAAKIRRLIFASSKGQMKLLCKFLKKIF